MSQSEYTRCLHEAGKCSQWCKYCEAENKDWSDLVTYRGKDSDPYQVVLQNIKDANKA